MKSIKSEFRDVKLNSMACLKQTRKNSFESEMRKDCLFSQMRH